MSFKPGNMVIFTGTHYKWNGHHGIVVKIPGPGEVQVEVKGQFSQLLSGKDTTLVKVPERILRMATKLERELV